MKFIEKEWHDYLMEVLPKDASVLQVVETRKAFYAGAGCVFYGLLNQVSQTENLDEVTDKDMSLMDGIQIELEAFLKE